MSKTKEDVMLTHNIGQNNQWLKATTDRVKEAMDEYAEQQSIEFAEWIDESGYEPILVNNERYFTRLGQRPKHTPKELYQLFLNDQNK
jgi:hypothetical protein